MSSWLDYLHSLCARSIDLELGRVQRVAQALQIQQPACPVITVAGTNGKGSVVGFLETLYTRAGYNVGAFTSPYLLAFNEQFRINECWISDAKLCEYFEKIETARGNIILTLFEVKTLAVLMFFAENDLDLWILEVGLGGRLDAVNIIDPDIAVITSISLDHCDWLGNTRELIGREKAGILRAGKMAVCGDLDPPVSIQTVADEIGAKVFYRDKDFFVIEKEGGWTWRSSHRALENLPEPMLLKDNVATALMVVECLGSLDLQYLSPFLPADESVPRGHASLSLRSLPSRVQTSLDNAFANREIFLHSVISNAFVPGRLQIISVDPFVVVDVSHNEDSVRRLAEFLKRHDKKNVVAVFSVLKTKDCATMVRVISPYIAEWHIAECDSPATLSLAQIETVLRDQQISAFFAHASISEAFVAAQKSSPRAIAIFGSFYVANEILVSGI